MTVSVSTRTLYRAGNKDAKMDKLGETLLAVW